MALPQGINFRATSGYVTDGANEYGEVATSTNNYPTTTGQGNNVGWESGAGSDPRNRSTSVDVRIAGIGQAYTNGVLTYRIDLPATGSHNIRAALGDSDNTATINCDFCDTNTVISTVSGSTAYGSHLDATGTEYTAANWPGSNTAINYTFSTTIFRLKLGVAGAATAKIAHAYIESAGGGAAGQPTMRRFGGVPGMGQGQTFGRSY